MRIAEPVQLPLDLAGPSQYACFRIAQRFPGPIQNGWVIAGDPQLQLAVLLARGGVEQAPRGALAEEGQEGLLAPGFQGFPNALGVLGFRREGVIEKRFQIPRSSRIRSLWGRPGTGNPTGDGTQTGPTLLPSAKRTT